MNYFINKKSLFVLIVLLIFIGVQLYMGTKITNNVEFYSNTIKNEYVTIKTKIDSSFSLCQTKKIIEVVEVKSYLLDRREGLMGLFFLSYKNKQEIKIILIHYRLKEKEIQKFYDFEKFLNADKITIKGCKYIDMYLLESNGEYFGLMPFNFETSSEDKKLKSI